MSELNRFESVSIINTLLLEIAAEEEAYLQEQPANKPRTFTSPSPTAPYPPTTLPLQENSTTPTFPILQPEDAEDNRQEMSADIAQETPQLNITTAPPPSKHEELVSSEEYSESIASQDNESESEGDGDEGEISSETESTTNSTTTENTTDYDIDVPSKEDGLIGTSPHEGDVAKRDSDVKGGDDVASANENCENNADEAERVSKSVPVSSSSSPLSSPSTSPPTSPSISASARWQAYRKTQAISHDDIKKLIEHTELEKKDKRKSVNYSSNNIHMKYGGNEAGMIRSLYMELQKLQNDKNAIREKLGYVFPEKYRHYTMFEEVKHRNMEVGYPPRGAPIAKFLLEERTRILRDIFVLNSLLTMSEDNKNTRVQITSLEKQVESLNIEVKALEVKREMLEKKQTAVTS